MAWKSTRHPRLAEAAFYSLIAGCVSVAGSPASAQPSPAPAVEVHFKLATPGVPTETLAQFQARQAAHPKLASRRSASKADVWCYVYSTALGLYWAPAGIASGAACLFIKDTKAKTAYSCYVTPPVSLGYGLVAAYGSRSMERRGKCKKGEWGYNRVKLSWSRFTK